MNCHHCGESVAQGTTWCPRCGKILPPSPPPMVTCYLPTVKPNQKLIVGALVQQIDQLESAVDRGMLKPEVVSTTLANLSQELAQVDLKLPLLRKWKTRKQLHKAQQRLARLRERRAQNRSCNPGQELTPEQIEAWEATRKVIADADEIVAGGRGNYPFDEAGKRAILHELAQGRERMVALAAAGGWLEVEAGLVESRIDELVTGVHGHRPTELREATCYMPVPHTPPAAASLDRLARRLPLLQKICDAGEVHPSVLRVVLPSLRADLHQLGREFSSLQPEQQRQARATLAAAQKAVDTVEELIKRAG